MFDSKIYSLHKCKKVLTHVYKLYKRKRNSLTDIQRKRFENILTLLQASILKKNKKAADRAAKNLESLTSQHLKKSLFEQSLDLTFALAFAIIVAIIVRQTWFEPYSIPSGSMRPTLKEKDFLVVSKTNFSINVPLMTKHFYFDPNLLNRGSIIVFTSANLDVSDPNMLYFYLFPGKKQFVKRLIGKPGDILYFYGGRIYGIDSLGNEIKELHESNLFKEIEHIPFIKFEGKIITPANCYEDICSTVLFYQMNEPIAMLKLDQIGKIQNDLIIEHSSVFTNDSKITNYYDIWGINNYATARILSENEAKNYSTASLENVEKAPLYLEITHHPTLKNAKIIRDELNRLRPSLSTSKSLIPLDEAALKRIFKSLYTARFCVKNGYAYRYGSKMKNTNYLPQLEDVKDGCYEIQNGEAFSVDFLGITKKLKSDHPLNQFSYEKTKILYNLGIEFFTIFNPNKKNQTLVPSRYAYFRNKDLYLMGHLIFKEDDLILVNFLQREYKKQLATPQYLPFEDLGPPIDEEGNLNKEIIKKYGLKVPEKMYLALGDNHAMSSDSRDFGFVPEENLKGGVNFIFWPPSSRWGQPSQPPYSLITLPKIVIWSSALVVALVSFIYIRRKSRKPLKF
jgi:signal peptidase I